MLTQFKLVDGGHYRSAPYPLLFVNVLVTLSKKVYSYCWLFVVVLRGVAILIIMV
jgi:hypothetical protein